MAKALDVWFKFDQDDDPTNDDMEPSHEANTFKRGGEFVVEWSHTAVGQISRVVFETYEDAHTWLTEQGFEDFSS